MREFRSKTCFGDFSGLRGVTTGSPQVDKDERQCVRVPYIRLWVCCIMCTCSYVYVQECDDSKYVFCLALGESIRGSGHVAQTRVMEGKEWEAPAGGGEGGGAHVWFRVLHMRAGLTPACMRAWIHMVLYMCVPSQ